MKKDIMWRVYIVFFMACLLATLIVLKIFFLQFDGDTKEVLAKYEAGYKKVEAARGDIYSTDGSLIATTLNYYHVGVDFRSDAVKREKFDENIDELSEKLSGLLPKKTKSQWKRELSYAFKNKKRWYEIDKELTYVQLQQLKKFPFFEYGRYKSGLCYTMKTKRVKPFGLLAERTIGKNNLVGLEGGFNYVLAGREGYQYQRRLSNGVWMAVNDNYTVDPKPGSDIVSTININIQDVAESALYNTLVKYEAEYGCVVVMEVETGKIRAIANLKVDTLGNKWEYVNYAVGGSYEPGSTFKLPTMMAGLEEGGFNLNTRVDTENGRVKYYDMVMTDSKHGGYGIISAEEAFVVSSNTAVSKLIHKTFDKNRQALMDRFYQFGITKELGVEMLGEGDPNFKPVNQWSGTTLPSMSIGYSLSMTPLQVLTFYNAVANNGRMMKPMFVEKVIEQGGKEVIRSSEVLKESICSEKTLKMAQRMLRGVVEKEGGTAYRRRSNLYSFAGKTGTARTNYGKKDAPRMYRGSFAGYFPADNPKYSCIVMVAHPNPKKGFYGGTVALPVFRKIADEIYAMDLSFSKKEIAQNKKITKPTIKKGYREKIEVLADEVGIQMKDVKEDVVGVVPVKNGLAVSQTKIYKEKMPDLKGMGLKDAIEILENKGLEIVVKGQGKVVKQSLKKGEKIKKGTEVILVLS